MRQRIVLLGPPASGKGTQAEMIKGRYRLPTVSPGAILREEGANHTALGKEADELIRHGQLLPDPVILGLVKRWLEKNDGAFVLDGFPRTLGQADGLENILRERRTPLEAVLSLEADFPTLCQRVENRLICRRCGRILAIGLQVTSAESQCASCGGELVRRSDDTAEVLRSRMQEYRSKSEPLLNYYQDRGLLYHIDATLPPEKVFASVVRVLEPA